MEQTVYADLLFLINFSMDFLCLYLSAKLLHRKTVLLRWLSAAALGGIYAVVALFVSVGVLLSLLIDLAVCLLLCALAFGRVRLIRSTAVFFAVSAALGGLMTALFHLLNRAQLPLGELQESGGSEISLWLFLLLAAISGVLTLLGGRFFRRSTQKKTAELEILYGGQSLRLSALADSGNLLRDPISGSPCVILDVGAAAPLLPPALYQAAKSRDAGAVRELPPILARQVRLIPMRTAAGDGVLLALRPQRLTVNGGDGAHEVEALIAFSEIGQSADGAAALLPTELLV